MAEEGPGEEWSLATRTVIVTGATAGIGKETAREIAKTGARVILPCRSQARGDAAREDIVKTTGNQNVVVKSMDLSSLASVRDFAVDINANESRLDLLVNNAGIFTKERQQSQDGHEMMFATNHLGHFLLTNLLLNKLEESGCGRIVNVSSEAARRSPLALDDVNGRDHPEGSFKMYGRSKAANVMFTVQLDKILREKGSVLSCYSLHPGVIKTELARDYSMLNTSCGVCMMKCMTRCCLCQSMLTPEQGARTTLHCCMAPLSELKSGHYYSDEKETSVPDHATNPQRVKQLWDLSCKMVGLDTEGK